MKVKYQNIVSRIVVAVLLLAVSSGFTVVHHACLMEQRQCCDTMASGGRMDATLPSEGASIEQAIMACCTNAITGGLHNLTALFEKQSKTEDQKLSPAISERDLSSQFSYPATEIRFFIQRTQAASPPSVEKYVLFASLLI